MIKPNVLITGCSSGLGKETAIQFAKAGYKVFAGVRKLEDADFLVSNFKDVKPIILDLTNAEHISRINQLISDECPKEGLQILINMAGYTFVSPIEYTKEENIRMLFETLFFGPVNLTNALLPSLKRHYCLTGERSKILNIISWASLDAPPFVGFYASAKAALLKLTEAQFYEFNKIEIDTIAIIPGLMKTPFLINKIAKEINNTLEHLPEDGMIHYGQSLKHMLAMNTQTKNNFLAVPPARMAKKIFRIAECKNPKSTYILGIDSHLIYLMNRFFPACCTKLFKRKLYAL